MVFPPKQRILVRSLALAFCLPAGAYANPTGPTVRAGSASFSQSGGTLQIHNAPGTIINWRGFSIGAGETTRFIQPNAASAVLNRVTGVDPSVILGTLQSNGRVFLLNPNGIAFGHGAVIDVAGLVASSLRLSDADFLAGRMRFEDAGTASKIVNQGSIRTQPGGEVYLVAASVENHGVIRSPNGQVILAAGKTVELVDAGKPNVSVQLTAPDNSALNVGEIVAGAGMVGIYGTTLRNSGRVSANSAEVGANGKIIFKAKDITLDATSVVTASGAGDGGKVTLQAEGGTLLSSGAITATGGSGKGGEVTLLGTRVGLADHATVDASGATGGGSVHIGGSQLGKGPLPNSEAVYLGVDTRVSADATQAGTGGKVIVYADQATRAYGELLARGAGGGRGGFIETSGLQTLEVGRTPDAGAGGTWLIDPNNLLISTTAGACTALTGCLIGPTWTTTNDSAVIGVNLINAALNNGQSVVLQTTTSGTNTQLGNVTFQAGANITKTSGAADASLTIEAHNDIALTQSIIASGLTTGRLNVTLTADSDSSGAGVVAVNNTVTTLGGSFTATGASVTGTAAGTITTTGRAATASAAGTSGGNVTITAQDAGSVSLAGAIAASGGLTVAVASAGHNAGSVTVTGGTSVSVAAITASGSAATLPANGGAGGAITLNPTTGSITLGGNLTANGGIGNGTGNGGAGGSITLSDAALLNAATVTIDSRGGVGGAGGAAGSGGAISTQAVDSFGARRTLNVNTVLLNSGTFTSNGPLGTTTTALAAITINAAGGIATGNISTAGTAGATGGVVTLNAGTASAVSAGSIDARGGAAIATNGFAGGAVALTGSSVSVDGINTSGSDAVAGTGGNATAVTLIGASGITLGGSIMANGGNATTTARSNSGTIRLDGPVTLTADATLSSVRGIGTTGGTQGTITLGVSGAGHTVNSDGTARDLTILGDSGAVTLNGALGNSSGLASLTVTTTGATTLRGNITTADVAGNDVRFSGPVTLGANVVVSTDNAINDGAIAFGNLTTAITTDAATNRRTLSLQAGGATIDNGAGAAISAIGTAALGGFTANGDTVRLSSVTTTGATSQVGGNISVTGATLASATGALTASGGANGGAGGNAAGSVTVTGGTVSVAAITANGSAALGTNTSGGAGGAVTIDSTASSVTLGGLISATGGAGNGTGTGGAGGAVEVGAPTGPITLAAASIITTGGASGTGGVGGVGGNITLSDAATLNAATVTLSNAGGTPTGGTAAAGGVVSTQWVDSAVGTRGALVVTAGSGSFNSNGRALGGTTALASVNIGATAGIATGNISTAGTTDVNGGLVTLNAGTGAITTGAIDTRGGTATAAGRAGGAVTITAGSLGASGIIDTSGSNAVTGNRGASGTITLNGPGSTGPLALTLDTTLRAVSGTGAGTNTGTVVINGAINSDATPRALTIEGGIGAVGLNNALGSTSGLASLTVTTTGTTTVLGNITTADVAGNAVRISGPVVVGGAAVPGANIIIDTDHATNDGAIAFGGTTINASSAASRHTLTLEAGSATIDNGAGGAIGAIGGTALGGFTANGGTVRLSSVTTTGAAGQAGGNISITGATLASVTGTLTASGGTAGSVAAAGAAAGSVSVTGGNVSVAAITANGGVAGATSNLAGGAGGGITLDSTAGSITLAGNLTANGGNGNGTGNGGAGGSITLSDAALLNAAIVTLDSRGGTGAVAGSGGAISTQAVDSFGGPRRTFNVNTALLNSGSFTSNGPLGGTAALASTTINAAGGIATGNISTAGGTADVNGGPIALNAGTGAIATGTIDTRGGTATTLGRNGGAVTLTGGTIGVGGVNTSGSNAASGNTVGGAAGTITFNATSGITLSGDLRADGGNASGTGNRGSSALISLPAVAVTLAGDVTIRNIRGSGAGTGGINTVTFNGTVDSDATARSLAVDSQGTVTFSGATGAISALDNLTVVGSSVVMAAASADTMLIRSLSGDVRLNGALATTASGDSLVIASAANFFNNAGATPLDAGAGRYLVYSTAPALNTFGGFVSPGNAFGRTYAANPPGHSSMDSLSGDRMVYSIAPTLSVSGDNQGKTYGGADPTLTYTVNSGLVLGDSAASSLTGALSTATGAAATAGTHAIEQGTLASNIGYNVTYTDGTLVVAKASLTATADDKSKTYGAADPTLTYTLGTLFYGDTSAVVSGVALSTSTGAAATAGTHTITASGGTAANYNISTANGTLTVGKATLTATADNKTKVYGAADPTLTYSVIGLAYSDTAAVVSGVSLSAPTGAAATFGTHTITASGGTAANYDITTANGTLNVDKAILTATADNKTKVYGAADPALTYSVTGLAYSDTAAVVSGVSLSAPTGAAATFGTHTITASGGTAANYDITTVNGTLNVDKATLTATADNKTKVYGAADPALTYSVTGLVYSDTAAVVSGVSLSAPTGAAATFGTHTITASGGTAANYDIVTANGTLNVDKASLTATADNKTKVYGAADPSLTYSVTGLAYSDTAAVVSGVSLSAPTGAAATFGTHTITALGGTAANYTISTANGTLNVDKATLTATADNKTKVYGAADPALTYSVTGLAYSDTAAVVSGVSLSAPTGAAATFGTHTITASGGTAANYDIVTANGALNVDKATLTATADNKTKVYGAADPALTYSVTGLVYSDTAAVVSGVSLSAPTGAAATFGTHTITASGGTAANYDITTANGTLNVDKATLTATADNKTKVYGAADPALTYSVTGLAYSDTAAVVSGVSLSAPTGAAATFGTHTITASGGTAANYDITTVNGTLNVDKATLTATADNKTKVYGAADPALTYSVTGLAYSDTAAVVSGVALSAPTGAAATFGTHTITASGGTAANYDITTVNGTLNVDKATLTATADNKTKVYGAADPALTYSVTGFVYTDTSAVVSGVSLSAPTGAAATFGTHTITASGGTAANYDITTVNGVLNVDKATLTATADNKTKVYGAADPALTYSVTGLAYSDTAAVVSGVALSAPTGAAATFGTHTITASGGTAANYTISTANGTLNVDKATLTATADNKTKVYGAADPALTYSVSGLAYSDTAAVVSGISLAAPTGAAATFGTHTITASGGTAANYDITTANGTLNVDKATLTATADNKTKVYGAADPALTYSVTGLVYSDTAAVVSGVSLSAPTGAAATFGTHTIAASGGTAANYDIVTANGTLNVDKATLTATADNKTKVYGAADPALTYSVSGLAYSDTAAVVSGVSLSAPTGAAATFGTHTITASGGTAANYDITTVNGTLNVGKATLTATADNKTKVYGAADPALTYSVTGLAYSDTASVVSGVSLSAPTGAAATFGTHTIAASGGTAANYDIVTANGTLNVDKAILTATADNKTKVYGAADPTLTYTLGGTLFYGDTSAVVSGVALSTSTGAAATAGTHTIAASGGTAANYSITTANGTLNVDKATLTATTDNKTKVYGAADPALTYSVTGLVYSDTAAVVSGVSLSAPTGAAATFGTHTITASGGTAANYDITTVNGTLNVDKATLTATADNKTKVYGAADPALTYSVTGLAYSDTAAVVSGVALSAPTGAAATFGTHTITASGGTAANYDITTVNGTLNVDKATLTATADNKTKVYGAADPALTYSVTGLVYSDTAAVVSGVSLSAPTGAAATFGTHTITASGGTAANYDITTANGTLNVDKATLTATADNKTKVYGAADPALTYSVTGLVYSDTAAVVSGVSLSAPTGAAATFGTHTITASGGTAANYSITTANGTLNVDKATLTATADNKTKVYGAADPALTYSVTGLAYSDTAAVVSGVSLSAPTGAAATFGTHTITASGGTAANYDITTANGTLNVDKATLTATADNKTKVYGAADPALTYSVTGLAYSDTAAVVSGVSLSAPTGAAATFGTHTIAASGGTAANYDIATVNGTLNVDKATLTATADNKTKVYGAADPALTYSVTGLVYSDTAAVVSGVSLSAPTGAAATFGTHTITASGGTAANYDITTANGTLNVDKATLTATADNKTKVYGAADPALTYSVTGLAYSDTAAVVSGVSLSAPIGAAATFGTHTITASGGTAANYNITTANGTLNVDKATLTATADNKTKVYGAADPALTYSVTGLAYSDTAAVVSGVSLSAPTGAAATFGTHTIAASGGTAANYDIVTANGMLNVDKATLTATADNKTKVYGAADPALTYSVTGLVYSDTAAVVSGVSLSAPTGAAATFGTHTIATSGGTAANYDIVTANGTLNVDKATLTATADNKTKVYGAADPALTYSVTGLAYSDTAAVVSGVSLSAPTGAAATFGTHTITASGGTAANYDIVTANGALNVDKAALTATADNKTKVYGAADPTLTYSVTGLAYSDTAAVVSGVALSAPTGAAATFGMHAITAAGGTAANYDITTVNGTLNVDKATLTATADNKSKTYGAADPTLTYTVGGTLFYGDTAAVVSGVGLSAPTAAAATAGTHAIAASGGTAANYDIVTGNGTLTVAKAAALTVTADDKSKTYGAADPALTSTVTGTLYYGDSAAVVTASLAAPTGAAATAGIHTISASGSAANYDVVGANGTLTVGKAAALTVSADDKSKTYGAADPALTYGVTGTLFYGDAASVVTASLSAPTGAAASAGTHAITASGSASNYDVVGANGTLTVAKAALVATADDKSKTYGAADPALTYSLVGLAYSDTAAVISGLSLAAPAGAAATAGAHAITASGGTAANYNITTANGTLNVGQAALTVDANDASRLAGLPNPPFSSVITGYQYSDTGAALTGTLQYATPANPSSAPGSYVVNPFGLGAANYSIAYLPGTLFVIDPSTTPDAAAGIAVNDTRAAMDRAMAGVATLALCALRSGSTISSLCPQGVFLNFGPLLSPPPAERWW